MKRIIFVVMVTSFLLVTNSLALAVVDESGIDIVVTVETSSTNEAGATADSNSSANSNANADSNSVSDSNSRSVSSSDNNLTIQDKREFQVPSNIRYPGLIADTTSNDNGPNFAPLHRMFRYKMKHQKIVEGRSVTFSYDEILMAVENVPDYWWNFFGDKVKKNITRYGRGKEDVSSHITITIPLDVEENGEIVRKGILQFKDMGYAHVVADYSEQVTWNILGLLLKELMENGYEYTILAAEGVDQVTWSKSLGLGLNTNSASISDDETTSKAGGGGTGFSYAEAGKDKYPTLQLNFGIFDYSKN